MAFTRFHDDTARVQKSLLESTSVGQYFLDTPGPGMQLPYMEDPQMRLQRWGANLMTDTTNLESDLLGISRKMTHNYDRTYLDDAVSNPTANSFQSSAIHVDESRATHPAWMYKDMDHTRWEVPFLNPQANLEKGFNDNIHTRMLEKDYYRDNLGDLLPGMSGKK